MDAQITPKERAELAEKCGINEQYLYQCLSGKRDMEAKQASVCERDTGGRLRRWMLRQSDWDVTWPELVGVEGAPPAPQADQQSLETRAA